MATLGITGASGQLATSVLRHLLTGQPDAEVIAVSRTPDKVLRASGIRARQGDFNDEGSVVSAFAGVERLLMIPASDLTPGVRPRQHRTAVQAAVAAGVRHIIYVSSVGARPGPVDGLLETHWATEQAVIGSSLPWTLIRMNIYADSQLDALKRALISGTHAALGGAPFAYVVRDDLGAACASVLAASGHEGVTFHGTGPASFTHEELAEAAARAAGLPLRFVPLSPDEAKAGLTAAGLPPVLVDVLSRFQRAGHDGAFDLVSGDIERLTGKPPLAATDFVATTLQTVR